MIIVNLFHKDPENTTYLYILDMIIEDLRIRYKNENGNPIYFQRYLKKNGVNYLGGKFEVDDALITLARLKFFK